MDSKSLSHTRWKCQYHIVFIPKYRKKQLYGRLREDVRSIIKSLCAYKNVEIVQGAVCSNHVHLCVCITPKMSVSSIMGYLKGKSALMIYDKHPELQSKWSKAFWASGNIALIGLIAKRMPQLASTGSSTRRNFCGRSANEPICSVATSNRLSAAVGFLRVNSM